MCVLYVIYSLLLVRFFCFFVAEIDCLLLEENGPPKNNWIMAGGDDDYGKASEPSWNVMTICTVGGVLFFNAITRQVRRRFFMYFLLTKKHLPLFPSSLDSFFRVLAQFNLDSLDVFRVPRVSFFFLFFFAWCIFIVPSPHIHGHSPNTKNIYFFSFIPGVWLPHVPCWISCSVHVGFALGMTTPVFHMCPRATTMTTQPLPLSPLLPVRMHLTLSRHIWITFSKAGSLCARKQADEGAVGVSVPRAFCARYCSVRHLVHPELELLGPRGEDAEGVV